MGRPAKYSANDILDSTAELIADGGPALATIAAIAAQLEAPSGSIYHRFASRDLIMANLWIRTIHEAQQGFLEALQIEDLDEAAEAASLHVTKWSRENLAKAQVLLLYRREDLVEKWPDELGDQLASLNDGMAAALKSYTRRRFGTTNRAARLAVMFALVDVPYGAVHRYLRAGEAPPPEVDDLIRTACRRTLRA